MWLVSWKRPLTATQISGNFFEFDIVVSFSGRFSEDKCIYKDDSCFFIQDGVLLNKAKLLGEDKTGLVNYIKHASKVCGKYFTKFKGPFTGCIYEKETNRFFAFGNQTGDACLFYYYDRNQFAVSSDFNSVFDWCSKNNLTLTLNQTAVNHLLSFGYIAEGNTFVKEIKKLNPGEFITLQNGELTTVTYHRFIFGDYSIIDLDEAIELVDREFRNAVKLCFDKDLEYGYNEHLVDISGGYDSRMTNWVARDNGYDGILNICYAQSGSNEEQFGRLVANALGNKFEFEKLDNVEFIYDLEKLVKMNYGMAVYAGITGGERVLSHLNFNKYGLEHTGQLGDVVLGYKGNVLTSKGKINTNSISYSTIIKPQVKNVEIYKNGEEFAFYYRYFHGTLATHYIRKYYTDAVSPFIDIDFAQLCFHISPILRGNHKLYNEWIKRKYPQAYNLPSTRSNESKRLKLYHMLPSSVGRGIIKFSKKIGLVSLVSDKRGMNPFDLWYENNSDMRQFINDYYESFIDLFSDYPVIKEQLKMVMNGERVMDKLQVLTVLAAYKLYFTSDMGNSN